MPTDRWREFFRDVKEVDGLTFEEIAARTEGQMSAASIQNALAPGATRDLTRETARIIENAILGASVAPPCPFDFLDEMSADSKKVIELEEELAQLRGNIGRTHDFQEKELAAVRDEARETVNVVRAEAQKKIDYLREENERLHKIIDKLMEK